MKHLFNCDQNMFFFFFAKEAAKLHAICSVVVACPSLYTTLFTATLLSMMLKHSESGTVAHPRVEITRCNC